MTIQNTTSFFAKAHKIAKETVAKVGDYRIAFKLALESLYEAARQVKVKAMRKPTKAAMEIYATFKNAMAFATVAKDRYNWKENTIKTQYNVCKKWFAA